MPFIKAMGKVANQGKMIPEQLWDGDDLQEGRMKRGFPAGSAMPLCWSHAEYISLVRSRHDDVCFDRVEPAFQRDVVNPVRSRYEMWSLRHQLWYVFRGKILRNILTVEASIVWSMDDWTRNNESEMTYEADLNLWFANSPTAEWPNGAVLTCTCFWKREQRWQGQNLGVKVVWVINLSGELPGAARRDRLKASQRSAFLDHHQSQCICFTRLPRYFGAVVFD